jgi:hypothetical protein
MRGENRKYIRSEWRRLAIVIFVVQLLAEGVNFFDGQEGIRGGPSTATGDMTLRDALLKGDE